ncbi:hypothetical protein [Agarilytica rhodophyticola]|uniref:hypothetical protein n=1 Tax=Agarilytica rhodophyticola TaxID=1737490 RepID=UPI000B346C97|nr:hypothetical protein [Agarilytica rhodophyticola]
MKLFVKFDFFYKTKQAKKVFNFLVMLFTSFSFLLAVSALLLLSEHPTIKSVVAGYEWLAVSSLVIWFPAILWVLFDQFVCLVANSE